ncbi:hypothetical protein NLX83_24210 [Allokutzneria sp. A3M-2-11 16]|uniref:hypothetical protein n=1 Tax=Allokutzneria sp. A3M-2-11 16 TaxID=2962043 RepID=UPI0020B69BD0|nr:hypothetical protein [Allokutzneria sp. A3M-2-11 16]MCP3802377.1 hypothetical protein [Allokutzneria sp. A3M-2-11 16]
MNAPSNWQQPPQQYPGWPQQPPPPPRKKRTGLVVGVIAGVLVLVVAGVIGAFYLDYAEMPGGGPGGQPVAQCDISAELKQQAKVSSFRLAGEPPRARGMKHSNCFWEQTAGKDGKDTRKLQIHVYDFRGSNRLPERDVEQARNAYRSAATSPLGMDRQLAGAEEATFVDATSLQTSMTEANLVARKGAVYYLIKYWGHDKGFFRDSPFPEEIAKDVVAKVAEELLAK